MRRKKRETEVFSMAFLDIVTCGLGAILLLLLITKPIPVEIDIAKVSVNLQSAIENVRLTVAKLKAELALTDSPKSDNAGAESQDIDTSALDKSIDEAQRQLSELRNSNQGLEVVKTSLKNVTIRVATSPEKRDAEVGGIPVDAEYVIFIVDTSGSMDEIWGQVIDVINRVLDIHPKVRGFQVMNDNGIYLIDSTRRKWIPDTSRSRESIKRLLETWTSFSNSSPVEGLEIALKTYAANKDRISVYIFGDDFTGSSYDLVIDTLKSLNTSKSTGEPIVRVHGIGFISGYGNKRYATLLRFVTERNRGAFLGLPN